MKIHLATYSICKKIILFFINSFLPFEDLGNHPCPGWHSWALLERLTRSEPPNLSCWKGEWKQLFSVLALEESHRTWRNLDPDDDDAQCSKNKMKKLIFNFTSFFPRNFDTHRVMIRRQYRRGRRGWYGSRRGFGHLPHLVLNFLELVFASN